MLLLPFFFFIRKSIPLFRLSLFPPALNFCSSCFTRLLVGLPICHYWPPLASSSSIKHWPYSRPIIVLSNLMCSMPLPTQPTLVPSFQQHGVALIRALETLNYGAIIRLCNSTGCCCWRDAGVILFLLSNVGCMSTYNGTLLLYR